MEKNHKSMVSVSKGDDPFQTAMKALGRIETDLTGQRVLIKPNVARLLPFTAGATIHPRVLAAAIDYCRDHGALEVAVGESPITGVKMSEAYEICGIGEVVREKKARLLDFDAQPFQILEIPHGQVVDRVKITMFRAEYDFIISLAVMKTHMHTGVTLSLKNMKGMLWRRQKVAFHQIHAPLEVTRGEKELDLAIADLATVLYPDMAIIDGIIGLEGMGPGSSGKPKGAGLIVASLDALSADYTACQLMGVTFEEIGHLRLAAARRNFNPENLETIPGDFQKWQLKFNPPPSKISFRYPGIKVHDQDSCSACQNTLFVFLERFHHRLWPYLDQSGPLNLALGKGVNNLPQGTICVGNCCTQLAKDNDLIEVPGCPPVASQIWEKVQTNHMGRATPVIFQPD